MRFETYLCIKLDKDLGSYIVKTVYREWQTILSVHRMRLIKLHQQIENLRIDFFNISSAHFKNILPPIIYIYMGGGR